MYNDNIKTRFIRFYTTSVNTAKVCEQIFNKTEPFETEFNCDICTLPVEKLQPIIDGIVGMRTKSKTTQLIILKEYARWCIDIEKYPGACDAIFNISDVGINKLRKQTLASPVHLQDYLNKICTPESEMETDNILRCYYWLAYCGVKEEDILNIKCSDVDLTTLTVRYGGVEIPIYREAIPAFKYCKELDQFMYSHPLYNNKIWKQRAPGDTLIRGVRSNMTLASLRVEISRRAQKTEHLTGLRLSYFRVWLSGLFFRTYQLEQIGHEPDFISVAQQKADERGGYKLDSGRNTLESKVRQIAGDYLEDYKRWKFVYHV